MKILKVDEKIIKKIKPNHSVIDYFTTPSKYGRLVRFDDNTIVLIETKGAEGEMFNSVMKNITETSKQQIQVIDSFKDKEERQITHFCIV